MPSYYYTQINDPQFCHAIIIQKLLTIRCVMLLLYTDYWPLMVPSYYFTKIAYPKLSCYCYIIQITGPNLCQDNYYTQTTDPQFSKAIIIHKLLTLNCDMLLLYTNY